MKKFNYILIALLVSFSLLTFANDCPSLSGEIIIGKSKASDFTTITEAVDAIKCGGISGPVTFMLESGTYNEKVVVTPVEGLSAFNPISFQSVSGNSSDVVISYGIGNASVVISSPHVSFENITIDHKGGNYGNCVRVEGKASNLRFKGVVFDGVAKAAPGVENATIYFSSMAPKSDIAFEDCEINYGSIGIWKSGMDSDNPDTRTTVSGSLFFGQTETGLALINDDAPVISSNVMSTTNNDKGYKAISLDNVSNNLVVSKNILNTSNGAMGLVMNNCMASATMPGLISGNTVAIHGTTESIGICLSGNTDNQVFNFNRVKLTLNADHASTQGYYSNTSTGRNINMMNNLFIDMNTGVYTVLGNSYKDFFNQLPGQSNPALSASANSISMEKVSPSK